MHCLKLADEANRIYRQEIHSYVTWQKKLDLNVYDEPAGSATFGVVTAVTVGLTVRSAVAPVLWHVWKPYRRMCSTSSIFIPCRGNQYALHESLSDITFQKTARFSIVLSVITDWTIQLRSPVEALKIFFMTNIKNGSGCNRLPIRGLLISCHLI
jgi:hypothetical protein